MRIGWLELAAAASADPTAACAVEPAMSHPVLEAAAELGALRAVHAGARRTVAIKPRLGPPVLEDLLREHFRGAALVLVRAVGAAPAMAVVAPDGDGYRLELEGSVRRLSAEALAALLRRPHPWGAGRDEASTAP